MNRCAISPTSPLAPRHLDSNRKSPVVADHAVAACGGGTPATARVVLPTSSYRPPYPATASGVVATAPAPPSSSGRPTYTYPQYDSPFTRCRAGTPITGKSSVPAWPCSPSSAGADTAAIPRTAPATALSPRCGPLLVHNRMPMTTGTPRRGGVPHLPITVMAPGSYVQPGPRLPPAACVGGPWPTTPRDISRPTTPRDISTPTTRPPSAGATVRGPFPASSVLPRHAVRTTSQGSATAAEPAQQYYPPAPTVPASGRTAYISGAATARDGVHRTWHPPRPPVSHTARGGTTPAQYHAVDHVNAGGGSRPPTTARGSRTVFGRIFDSLKSTLGMHSSAATPPHPPLSARDARDPPPHYGRLVKARQSACTPEELAAADRHRVVTAVQYRAHRRCPTTTATAPTVERCDSVVTSSSRAARSIQRETTPLSPEASSVIQGAGIAPLPTSPSPSSVNVPEPSDLQRSSPTHTPPTLTNANDPKKRESAPAHPPKDKVKPPKLNLSAVLKSNNTAAAAETQQEHVTDSGMSPQTAISGSPQFQSMADPSPAASGEHETTRPTTAAVDPSAPTPMTVASTTTMMNDKTPPSALDVACRTSAASTAGARTELSPEKPSHVATTSGLYTTSGVTSAPKSIRFSWIVARALIKLQMQPAETFSVNGVPWSLWELHQVPTLGASPTSCRVQEMYKATIPAADSPSGKKLRVFLKSVPVSVWRKQWECQNKWNGDYVTDGENFVMEAAALAFLQQYGPNLAPRLLGILELSTPIGGGARGGGGGCSTLRNGFAAERRRDGGDVTHVVIVSELYGEDLLDFLEKREREKQPLSEQEKISVQFDCLSLLSRLHSLNLAHLDFTPENVLYGRRGLRLCDFAKATPLHTATFRHVTSKDSAWTGSYYPFESCEPTVGKGAYMPPECWKVYWRLEDTRVQYPLDELWSLTKPSDRAAYYFRVDAADVYMAGVLLFWLWSEGGIWKCSDVKQDEKYNHLVRSGLNFDLFRECRSWPAKLKDMLQCALMPDPKQRAGLETLLMHPWFDSAKAVTTRERYSRTSMTTPPARPDTARPDTARGDAGATHRIHHHHY